MLFAQSPAQPKQLRYYQREAIEAVWHHLRTRKDNPCVVLPTGGGKTLLMAEICRQAVEEWNGRVLVLSHVKELIEQTVSTLENQHPHMSIGAYSAGLNRRDTKAKVLVAGIQSVHNKGLKLAGAEPFNLVLVDEAHRIPTDGDGMYRSLLTDLTIAAPSVRVIGLTATPYRLAGGYVCSDKHFLNAICYEVGVKELIAKGFLSRLTSKQTESSIDASQFGIRKGEFKNEDMSAAFGEASVVDAACREIVQRTADRQSILLFCCDVDHAENVAATLATLTDRPCGIVTGKTPTAEREKTIAAFKSGRLRWLANVNVLTEGFDATRVDCVCLMRSTLSPGLYYQMVGRGLRQHPGKSDCLVLDFGGNVMRHGCIDDIKISAGKSSKAEDDPTKVCRECDEVIGRAYSRCPECDYVFPAPEKREPNHFERADNTAILSDQVQAVAYPVDSVGYIQHTKRGAEDGDPRTLRVTYYHGLDAICDEWVCVEHPGGFARSKAVAWWQARSEMPMPADADEAVRYCELGLVAEPMQIQVLRTPGERFPKIVGYTMGVIPEARRVEMVVDDWGDRKWIIAREPGEDDEPITFGGLSSDDDDIPF